MDKSSLIGEILAKRVKKINEVYFDRVQINIMEELRHLPKL